MGLGVAHHRSSIATRPGVQTEREFASDVEVVLVYSLLARPQFSLRRVHCHCQWRSWPVAARAAVIA